MNTRFARGGAWLSVFVRYLVLLALAACASPTQSEEIPIFSRSGGATTVTYKLTEDSIVLGDGASIVELELDGTLRGTIFDQPFLQMTAGHGWVAWVGAVRVAENMYKTHFWRRDPTGRIEEIDWPKMTVPNVDSLLATPDGIVINETYSETLMLWGATSIEPLELGETDVWPLVFDSGWLYARVNGSTGSGQITRFRLDGSRKELLVGGTDPVTSFAVRGTRAAYVGSGYPATPVRIVDLETLQNREIGELGHDHSYSAIAVDDDDVFVDRYRHHDRLSPFLPLSSDRIVQLDILGEDLFWSTAYLDRNGYPGPFSIYRTPTTGEAPTSSTGTDDTRPPWL